MVTITFSVQVKKYADNLSDSALATAIKADLDAKVTTVHSIGISHVQGFWVVIAIYV